MRTATLAAVVVGGTVFVLDILLIRFAHVRDPFYWLSLAVFASGLLGGAYVRRNDPHITRNADGLGVTAAIRATLGLWDPEKYSGSGLHSR